MRPYMLGRPILEAKSSISLFMRNPRPSTVTPEPKRPLRVYVLETALPLESTIEKCVVWVDSDPACGSGGRGGIKPVGRWSSAEGVGLAGSMELRQAAAYAGFA